MYHVTDTLITMNNPTQPGSGFQLSSQSASTSSSSRWHDGATTSYAGLVSLLGSAEGDPLIPVNDTGEPAGDDTIGNSGRGSWEVPFLASVCVFGVLGNIMVVAVYVKAFRKTNSALYILSLAAGDLFILLVVVSLHITEYYPSTWPILWHYDVQCILHRYGRFIGFNMTVFTMVAIAVDRYIAVCHPLVFKTNCTPARTKVVIGLTFVLSAVLAAPCVLNFRVKYKVDAYIDTYIGKTQFACRTVSIGQTYSDFKVIYVSILLFWVPVLITGITYVAIVIFVRRNNQKFGRCRVAGPGRQQQSHWKAARVLLIVFCVYVMSYVFFATFTLVQKYGITNVGPLVKNLGLLFPYANSCMNPLVYFVINQSFRRECFKMVCPKRTRGATTNSGDGLSSSRQHQGTSSSRTTDDLHDGGKSGPLGTGTGGEVNDGFHGEKREVSDDNVDVNSAYKGFDTVV